MPRVLTPPLRPLEPRSPETERCTLGYDVIDFARDVLGIELYPWQQWLLVHMLELLVDGSLRFRTVVVLVARQNGKSTLSRVLALWFMIEWGWPLVLGTAQDLDVAEEIWQGAVDLLEDDPDLADLIHRVVRVNGKKALELTSPDGGSKVVSRYKVKAASRRAGRGLTGNLIMLDELREHQSWDAWGAITKTTMAQAEALILTLSNAGDAASIVLRYLRKMGHQALGDPDGIVANDDPSTLLPTEVDLEDDDELDVDEFEQDEDTLGLFEWSAAPGRDIWDREGWQEANPSLGYSITERTVASAAKTDPEWVFRTEVLCQWSDGSLDGPFPPGTWDAGVDPTSELAAGEPFTLCVDVSWDRATAHIAAAGYRHDGLLHVEVIAKRAGTDWVVPWFKATPDGSSVERRHDPLLLGVTWQEKGAPVSSLGPALLEVLGDKAHGWTGSELGPATGALYDLVRGTEGEAGDEPAEGQVRSLLRHRPQPVLDVAAATAHVKPISDAWVWDRRNSPVDAAPLVAVTGAAWLAQHPPETDEPPPPPLVFGM